MREFSAVLFDFFSAKGFSCAVGSDVHNSKINTENPFGREKFWIIEVTNNGNIPVPAHEHQIDFALAMLKKFSLMFATDIFDFPAPVQKPDRNNIIGNKAENSIIIGLRRCFPKTLCDLFLIL